jgi:hypothetical protein
VSSRTTALRPKSSTTSLTCATDKLQVDARNLCATPSSSTSFTRCGWNPGAPTLDRVESQRQLRHRELPAARLSPLSAPPPSPGSSPSP